MIPCEAGAELSTMIANISSPLEVSPITEIHEQSITGFVLAGGASRRMGRDKGNLVLAGKSFVEHIIAALSPIVGSISVVGREFKGPGLRIPSIPDVYENWGALGGLHAALQACQSPWAAVVACDLPFVTTDLFRCLASRRQDYDAVAPIQRDGVPQPLCALYRREACLVRAEQLIDSGERRPVALLQLVGTCWVQFAELADLEGSQKFFDNINTPEDYENVSEKGGVIRRRD